MDGLEARKLLVVGKDYTEGEVLENYRREYERYHRMLSRLEDEERLSWLHDELERLRVAREVLLGALRDGRKEAVVGQCIAQLYVSVEEAAGATEGGQDGGGAGWRAGAQAAVVAEKGAGNSGAVRTGMEGKREDSEAKGAREESNRSGEGLIEAMVGGKGADAGGVGGGERRDGGSLRRSGDAKNVWKVARNWGGAAFVGGLKFCWGFFLFGVLFVAVAEGVQGFGGARGALCVASVVACRVGWHGLRAGAFRAILPYLTLGVGILGLFAAWGEGPAVERAVLVLAFLCGVYALRLERKVFWEAFGMGWLGLMIGTVCAWGAMEVLPWLPVYFKKWMYVFAPSCGMVYGGVYRFLDGDGEKAMLVRIVASVVGWVVITWFFLSRLPEGKADGIGVYSFLTVACAGLVYEMVLYLVGAIRGLVGGRKG